MNRPYQDLFVNVMEKIFEECPKTHPLTLPAFTILRDLEAELKTRSSPRAAALQEQVQAALRGAPAPKAAGPAAASIKPSAVAPNAPVPRASPIPAASAPAAASPAPAVISPQEAFATLKAGVSATWEELEGKRRAIVALASPALTRSMDAEKRQRIEQEAKRANAAMEAILKSKVERAPG